MPEEELNKYFEQAREATLAEIGINQQALLENAANTQQQEEVSPVPKSESATISPVAGIDPNMVAKAAQENPGTYVGGGMTMPAGTAGIANTAADRAFDNTVEEIEAEKAAQDKQAELQKILNPQAMRAENSRKWIAGIGDALASVANLIGTAHDASNQKQTYMLPGVNAAIEQDRARRNAQYQKQLEWLNKRTLEQMKIDADAAAKEADRKFRADEAQKNRDATAKQNAINNQLNREKFEHLKEQNGIKNDLAERNQENNEWYRRQQVAIGWARANKGDDDPDPNDGNSGRYSGKRGGGMTDAKVDYNLMLDEIAENRGCESWADLANRAQNDRELRKVYNQFDFDQYKGSPSQIEHKISTYARDWAPKFHAYYFGGGVDDDVDLGEGAWTGGNSGGGSLGEDKNGQTLDNIANSRSNKKKTRLFGRRKG